MVPEKVKSIKSKKLSSMKKDEVPGKEYGAKPGEITLKEVDVKGSRPDLNKEKIFSDEYKARLWHQTVKKTDENPKDVFARNRLNYDFDSTEEMHKKRPGALGKVNVTYSDGTVKKLGEKYEVPNNPAYPGVRGQREDKVLLSRIPDWRQWHKDTYPEHYETKSESKEAPEVKKIGAMKKP